MSIPGSSSLPLHLFDFVNRADELDRFRALVEKPLEARRERILIFHGPKGIGKTLLLDRIAHECSLRAVPMARISFEGGMYNNYLRIMRAIREQLGAAAFADWTELVNYYYPARPTADVTLRVESAPGRSQVNVQAADDVTVGGDLVGGNKIEIRDNFIFVPRGDVDPTLIQDSLTDKLIEVLERFVQSKAAVFLFDSVDHNDFDPLTRRWLWQSLIDRASRLGGLGLVPVVALVQRPQLERALEVYTKQQELKPLSRGHVEEYLRRRDVPTELVSGAAMVILTETEGSPARMAEATEKILELLAQEGPGR